MSAGNAREPVGSAAQEAARLAESLHAWWAERDVSSSAHGDGQPQPGGSASSCRYCPLCRGVAAVHALRPEVLTHLVAAAESVAAALRELAHDGEAPARPHADRGPGGPTGPRTVRIRVDDAADETHDETDDETHDETDDETDDGVEPAREDVESREGH